MLSTMIDYLGGYNVSKETFTKKVLEQVPNISTQNPNVQENFQWKRNGLTESFRLVFFGDKIEKPKLKDVYIKAIKNIVIIANFKKTEQYVFGHDAYTQWAEALLDDNDFLKDSLEILENRLDVHCGQLVITMTGREYAAQFLLRSLELASAYKDQIEQAICFLNQEKAVLNQIWSLHGGWESPEIAQKLASRDFRTQLVKVILNARDLYVKAVQCLS